MTRVLLIEDNHDLGTLFAAKARLRNLSLEVYESLGDLGAVGRLGEYDVVIVDYNLGSVSGIEISQYLDRFFRGVPAVLISAYSLEELPKAHEWPSSIRQFLSKTEGVDKILDVAVEEAQRPRPPRPARAPVASREN